MSAILYHVPLAWIRTQRKLLMPDSVHTSSRVLIFIEQAQYSLLVPSFLQPLYNFYLTLCSLSGRGARPSYFTKESLFLCLSEFIRSLHPLIYCTSFTNFKEVGPLLDNYPLEAITLAAVTRQLFQKLGPKYLPMGTYRLAVLPLGTEGSVCWALEPSSPLTPHHAGDAPATALLLPQQCPRSAFQCWKIPVGSEMSIPTHLWSLGGNPYPWGRHQVGRVMLLTLLRKAFIDGRRGAWREMAKCHRQVKGRAGDLLRSKTLQGRQD